MNTSNSSYNNAANDKTEAGSKKTKWHAWYLALVIFLIIQIVLFTVITNHYK